VSGQLSRRRGLAEDVVIMSGGVVIPRRYPRNVSIFIEVIAR
jgi:hypothetical protein